MVVATLTSRMINVSPTVALTVNFYSAFVKERA